MIGPCFISSKSLTAGAILVAAEGVLKALKHVWVSLEPLHAPMAVMGGLARAAWRHVRATRDVDLLIGVSEEDLKPLLSTLISAGLRPKYQPAVTFLGSMQILQLLYEPPGSQRTGMCPAEWTRWKMAVPLEALTPWETALYYLIALLYSSLAQCEYGHDRANRHR
jgi:hypothetical protein